MRFAPQKIARSHRGVYPLEMSSKVYSPIRTRGIHRVRIGGSFRPAGTGAVTNVKGKGFTVARSGVGLYTVTINDVYNSLEECEATGQTSDNSFAFASIGAWDPPTRTLVIGLYKLPGGVATLTDMAANANNVVHFSIIFKNTGVNF